ncbi:sigma-54-dependent Fis family transcriptional regulator [Pseudomonas syringae pv. actinidiae]|uniref:Transcriptional regulator of acetoin/glycerol metabolism n=1 Tax=Pseudomonas syringae pv. actinidiae TaxID=103796 RepID=A0AAN4TN93_PSESF|nr:sigma-54-dependent Fis family transcriptional regulator [Pseudomonas syringae]EPN67856.1 sigma-54 dependent transcriptional regulator [Pseudomonas syringae pv. actinidiae ICMP 19079]EPN68662.1 sigma-54 dependent transcriptional regulator [Pseudomonas syringae pv. actinidiae ICMP 19101]AKT31566.1 Fis family transcriptional regulator [Pseudomonas syringae pv. actinidiae ICMP 18884]AOE57945.1 Fis family transcriptional regulator [Pseudomonas syringae pv. actinidiae ICMP 18708]APP98898.1 sigma-
MSQPSASLAHDIIIQDSWTRCRDFGLSHQTRPSFGQLPGAEVSRLLERHHGLVQTTHQEVLPVYENILSNSNCLIMLADTHGQLLKSWGNQRFVEASQTQGFMAGASWSERGTGTNAIGTALACEQAIHIEPDEHFLKANRFMTGSASPIFDADRRIIAVLDVSSDSFLPPSHTLGMVKMMSQSVENRLILDQFRDTHFQLIFNTGLNNLDSQWAGLLIFDESGRILCANRRADNLLGTRLSGVNIETLFKCPILQLLSETEARPFALHAFGNNRFQCLLKRPTRKPLKLHSVQPVQAPVAPRSLDLEAISLGDAKIEKAVLQAQRLLEKDIPLLIHGETGVGKEVFVKALHQAGSRANEPLIAVNCAAIPAELVEAELFGYERGAFTGANQKGSIGLIRKAHKGTLFLDEVGDMPMPVQARLLRVLQERCVQPLGSSELYPVDIRLISATNRTLRDQVQAGHFRQDLYYRISGLNIELPPLRERTDKHALIQRIWERHRDAHQRAGFSREVLELFEHHPWPGNIRQLNSVIQVALALADEQPISAEHLPEDFLLDMGMDEECREPVQARQSPYRQSSTEDLSHQLQAAGGNISLLAKQLGVSRNTLYKRLREQRIV